ncbi:hypothetical protein MHZ92_11450 [Sporosarcina sp. ACRSL]|uniref:hypothetical protein n=1 Tax=Sporosarcina sp. ACRSL TaxID=2918215 RepID=UPI001EF520AA|nr:hypothetical protein [Sporosarcina sp. ACRSL]MCG7344753.1 hypothetical protein [Sporosarcina sp. ACRSL]
MEGKVILKKRHLIILILLMIIIYFGPSFLGGYYLTERSAIRNSFPNDGIVVLEKDVKNKKIVVWDTGQNKSIELIESNFGFLHRPILGSEIFGETPDKKMKTTWAATHHEGVFYNTIFAAEALDEDIVKVIVSNEPHVREIYLSLKEVEEQSTIFVEMVIENGVAIHYSLLPTDEVGNFTFRGVDAEGNVVTIF